MNVMWAEVICECPSEDVERFVDFLVSLSGNGVCTENLDVDTFSPDTIEEPPVKKIKTYFVSDSSLENKISAIKTFMETELSCNAGFIPSPPTVLHIREEDWANNWKIHFRPSRVGAHLIIKPTWEDSAGDAEDIVIELDPGMAFGTGTHPTSRLCLEMIERILTGAGIGGADVACRPDLLDVGTGSGILAIAAAKLGATRVVAIDIDTQAVDIAKENVILNHVDDLVSVDTTPVNEVAGDFSIVVANIQAEHLASMADSLAARTRSAGILILSGILTEKESVVYDAFARFPLKLSETTREGDWSCITYQAGN